MRKFKIDMTPLKRQWNENPLAVLAVGAAVVTAGSKLLDTASGVQSRRAYAKQVNKKNKKK